MLFDIRDFESYDGKHRRQRRLNKNICHTKQRE